MSRTETKGERQRQNRIPVTAHTSWKRLLHKLFPWALINKPFVIFTNALFKLDAYF